MTQRSNPPGPAESALPHDGIEEHDNFLPRWWLATLFGAILFSLGYWFYYHTTDTGVLQRAELAADEKDLSERRQNTLASRVSVDSLLASSKDPEVVARGAEVFKTTCSACHGLKGEGTIGPNLTDAYWLHGSKPLDIFKTVNNGVPEKGMPSWGLTLGVTKVIDSVSYVLTIQNKNLAGKAPQGDKEAP